MWEGTRNQESIRDPGREVPGSRVVCTEHAGACPGHFLPQHLFWVVLSCSLVSSPAHPTYQEHEDDGALVNVVYEVTRFLPKPAPAKRGVCKWPAEPELGTAADVGPGPPASPCLRPKLQGYTFPRSLGEQS